MVADELCEFPLCLGALASGLEAQQAAARHAGPGVVAVAGGGAHGSLPPGIRGVQREPRYAATSQLTGGLSRYRGCYM